MVKGVGFTKGESSIEISVSSICGDQIKIRVDEINGALIATVEVNTSCEAGIWKTLIAPAKSIEGIHDLYFVFKGKKDLFDFDWWKFHSK